VRRLRASMQYVVPRRTRATTYHYLVSSVLRRFLFYPPQHCGYSCFNLSSSCPRCSKREENDNNKLDGGSGDDDDDDDDDDYEVHRLSRAIAPLLLRT